MQKIFWLTALAVLLFIAGVVVGTGVVGLTVVSGGIVIGAVVVGTSPLTTV